MTVIKKTPGVYIEEISYFPPAIAAVDTAIPAFIGYTDKEENKLIVRKIRSLLEFEEVYCNWDDWKLTYLVNEKKIDEDFSRNELYYHMQLYFANGGGKCYIISLGRKQKDSKGARKDYTDALDVLDKEDEPTLIVLPEAVYLEYQECMDVYKAALAQAARLMDRFVIMDVPQNNKDSEIKSFRDGIGTENLHFGAAYYPYLNTSISKYSLLNDDDIIVKNSTRRDGDVRKTRNTTSTNPEGSSVIEPGTEGSANPGPENPANLGPESSTDYSLGSINLQKLVQSIKQETLVLPPSAAIAGLYSSVDAARGVWKAPANVSLNYVSGLDRKISHEEQAELNIHPEGGKSINAIRSFTGRGILVWGSRTLKGNDKEWQYINVRRFYNFVEESIKKATQQFVFEANDANTWVRVSTMIENFLTNLWRQGALAGATPIEAFFVKVGLGVTMTFDDILNGIMNIEIGLAVVRPAEFIVLKFSQKIQES